MSAEPLELDRLAEPPRPLPAALAARVRLNGPLVVGLVWLGLSSLGLIAAFRYSPLPGEWYLLWERREAPGWLLSVHKSEHRDKRHALQVSYSYHYEHQ